MSSVQVDPSLLPPLDRDNLIGIWISTMLYGTNIILFFLCMYVLVQKKAKCPGQYPLLATSSALFVLATLHIGASLEQLIQCFVDGPRTQMPGASILCWLSFTSTVQKIKAFSYTIIDTTQDLVLIWRLYVVWNNRWQYALLPFLLEMAHFVLGIYETVVTTRGGGIAFDSKLTLVPYILVILVNVGTTAGIAFRLWFMGRRHADSFVTTWSSVSRPSNRYWTPIFTIIESGAIFTLSSIVLLAMIVRGDSKIQSAVNVATQLAAATPLLIIVRVGFGITHSFGKRKSPLKGRNCGNNPPHPGTVTEVDVFQAVEIDESRATESSFIHEEGPLDIMRDDKPTRPFADSKV